MLLQGSVGSEKQGWDDLPAYPVPSWILLYILPWRRYVADPHSKWGLSIL